MNLKIKSKIKSDIFRNQAPRVGSFYTRTAALRLWAHRRVFFMSSVRLKLLFHTLLLL